MSVAVTVPLTTKVPSSFTAPACTSLVITGASLVPVMVIFTLCVAEPPLSSRTVTVKVSVWISPSASDCTLEAAPLLPLARV